MTKTDEDVLSVVVKVKGVVMIYDRLDKWVIET